MAGQIWAIWWAWIVAGLVLAIIEIFAPGFFFLGFAIGAGVTGIVVMTGLASSLPVLLVIFALSSAVAWFVVRRLVGVREGQVKIWDRDINNN
ncbi:hypothetical protein Q9295_09190 [Xinfangfangia sp. CPCC 101601]|uniref:NfeD family protein n=1 Tax=Pseudogemmobacter lacusdianii TaxID=3069608 RepID=A0ABU0VY45_9RHOB|nr:hypothetical protein [Xinfangfangia sp. CPCC 101601]MDQ2066548.1 hypothetical protein [Xinfangfangia sp. CPCC 101601]